MNLFKTIFIIIFIFCGNLNAQFNSVKIAHVGSIPYDGIPDNLLQRIKNAGYTHIIGSTTYLQPNEWLIGVFDKDHLPVKNQRDRLTRAFSKAYDYGLKFIPLIPAPNKHGSCWTYAQNQNINYQPIYIHKYDGELMDEMKAAPLIKFLMQFIAPDAEEINVSYVTSYAENSDGLSKTYKSLINDVIYEAFGAFKREKGLGSDYDLEYIHMGWDEILEYSGEVEIPNKLMIGKTQEDLKWLYENDPTGSHYYVDRDDIASNDVLQLVVQLYRNLGEDFHRLGFFDDYLYFPAWENASEYEVHMKGVRQLFANNISERVKEIKEKFPRTQCLIYADMLDPQHNGGYLRTDKTVEILKDKIITVDGSPSNITNHLILVPWVYRTTYTHNLEGDIEKSCLHLNLVTTCLGLNAAWVACSFIPSLIGRLWCYAHTTKWIYDKTLQATKMTATIAFDASGKNYKPAETMSYFINNNFRVIYCNAYERDEIYSHTINQTFKWIDGANNYSQAIKDAFIPGFEITEWGGKPWDKDKNMYEQPNRFNIFEVVSSCNNMNSGDMTSLFFNDLAKFEHNSNKYLISTKQISNLDFFCVTKNVYNPSFDIVDQAREYVSFNDVLLFCNMLSKREGLDTVYRYNTIMYNDKIGDFSQDFYCGKGSIISSMMIMSPDYTKNGYFIPNMAQLIGALNGGVAVADNILEWLDAIGTGTGGLNTNSHTWVDYQTGPFPDGKKNFSFRVMRNMPTNLLIENMVIDYMKKYYASNDITFKDIVLNPGGNITAEAGRNIRVLPEFWAKRGSNLILKIDPNMQ